MTKTVVSFFHLISCVVNQEQVDWRLFEGFSPQDWVELYKLSQQQGVVAVVFDRIKDIPKEIAPPRQIVLKWLAQVFSIEKQMSSKEQVAVELAAGFAERGIELAVLKGVAYASYYPNPYHREFGDLDCYLMGKKEEGDRVITEIGGKMEEAGYKHSHLYYKGLTIENHNYLTSFDNTKRGIRTERLLQSLLTKGVCTPIGDSKLLNPCADFNAMFLLKHAQRHFIKEGIRVRHLLDWAFFLKAESANVDWSRVVPMMEECCILNFAKVMTQLCIDKLGMTIDVDLLKCESPRVSEAVIADIMGDQPDLFHENFVQKVARIVRRSYRIWKFRELADESYSRLMWNSFVFSSYLKRDVVLE